HTGLARVARDNFAQRLVVEGKLLGGEAILAQLPRHEVTLRDLQLLTLGVSREIHGLEPVEQWPGDILREIRGCNEQDLGVIKRRTEVVVGERVVLRRVEDLEQRRRR